MERSQASGLPHTCEVATASAGICNPHDLLGRRQAVLLGTRTTAADLDSSCSFGSKSGCLFYAELGKKLWPSTPPVAQAGFSAGLPSGRSKREIVGGPEKPRLPGPRDGERPPPRGSAS